MDYEKQAELLRKATEDCHSGKLSIEKKFQERPSQKNKVSICVCGTGRLSAREIAKISEKIADELNKPKKYEAQASLTLRGENDRKRTPR